MYRWVVVLLLMAAPANAEYIHGVLAHPVKDKRWVKMLDELCRKGGIRVPVRLYRSSYTPKSAFIARVPAPFLHAAIVVSEKTLRTFSSPAMRGLLGHELGHLVSGHVNGEDWEALADRERKIQQHQADAFSIRISGRDAFYVFLRTNGAGSDCTRYIDFIDAALNLGTIPYDPDNAP